ncbi:MAG TPA: threonylcarbamoyl-AMP synthase, partial [Phycisphaerales bacterium]|nr:threonylcarbamoyl-AMP synthase [Phycisphaerales bacterium]
VAPSKHAFGEAAHTLKRGGIVAFATETVYGLGCDTCNEDAIKKVYALKDRPMNNPMIAHVLEVSWVRDITTGWDKRCDVLAENFWPGPLTIVLPRHKNIPKLACGGLDTIAIRCPSHPVARELLEAFGGVISAPSANRSGYISPTSAQHVQDEFQDEVTILDGGACEQGIESTVISMVETPTILRLGSVSQEELESVLGDVQHDHAVSQTSSPGTSMKHYSPNTPTQMCTSQEIVKMRDDQCVAIVMNSSPIRTKQTIHLPATPQEYGARLYAALREADACGASRIVIEQPPATRHWVAVNDRLFRCTSV